MFYWALWLSDAPLMPVIPEWFFSPKASPSSTLKPPPQSVICTNFSLFFIKLVLTSFISLFFSPGDETPFFPPKWISDIYPCLLSPCSCGLRVFARVLIIALKKRFPPGLHIQTFSGKTGGPPKRLVDLFFPPLAPVLWVQLFIPNPNPLPFLGGFPFTHVHQMISSPSFRDLSSLIFPSTFSLISLRVVQISNPNPQWYLLIFPSLLS